MASDSLVQDCCTPARRPQEQPSSQRADESIRQSVMSLSLAMCLFEASSLLIFLIIYSRSLLPFKFQEWLLLRLSSAHAKNVQHSCRASRRHGPCVNVCAPSALAQRLGHAKWNGEMHFFHNFVFSPLQESIFSPFEF